MSVAWLWLAPLLLVLLVMLLQWVPLLASVAVRTTSASVATDQPQTLAVRLYTPLELRGRDIYLREGCSGCHSQLVRLLDSDTQRYGGPSQARDTLYDHPVQWGLRRYGPDLSHIGGKYPHRWHRQHLAAPRSVAVVSTMPAYPWLLHNRLSYADLPERLRILRSAGLPYSLTAEEFSRNVTRYGRAQAMQFDIHRAEASLLLQARQRDFDGNPALLSEMDALIAYIQVIGVPASAPVNSPASTASAAALGSVANSAQ